MSVGFEGDDLRVKIAVLTSRVDAQELALTDVKADIKQIRLDNSRTFTAICAQTIVVLVAAIGSLIFWMLTHPQVLH